MHEYNMQFLTPTVNYFMSMPDFVTFCEDIPHYLELSLGNTDEKSSNGYPVCKLGDLKLHGVHYKTYEEFNTAWIRRKGRVNFDRILIIMTDRDGFTPDLLPRIEKIPYKKVLFSHVDYPEYDFVCKVPGFDDCETVGSITDYRGVSGKRLYSYYNFKKVFDQLIKTES